MEITADRLEVDHRAGKATFSGHVVATRGDTTLRCERIDATYAPDGGLKTVVAAGAVDLVSRKLRASAATATYVEAESAVLLEGDLRLSDGTSTLTGERARVLLDEERFIVERARGKLVFAAPAAAPARASVPKPAPTPAPAPRKAP